MKEAIEQVAEALNRIGNNTYSPNCCDSNLEPANLVDGLYRIGDGLLAIAKAIKKVGEGLPTNDG